MLEVGGDEGVFFDLASVTKPMTAVAVALSGLDPAAPLGELVSEARGTASERIPLELFLAHRAGLHAHLPLYEPLTRAEHVDPSAALRQAAHARRGTSEALYSDLGYLLAGEALARHTGSRDAGDAIRRLVLEPLGVNDAVGTARDLEGCGVDLPLHAAPTEEVAWRGGVVRGRVHDENAWAISGEGGSGHAGLFGTVLGTLRFGAAVLDALDGLRTPFPPGRDLAWVVRERPGGTLRAGFDGKSAEGSSAGERFGPNSFGHLGFTGTSLWIDPDAKVVAVLLTNRVHPTRENLRIKLARPVAHDALHARAIALR
jgi:serine-type D-Ala-D-Ala carboxypeptidase